MTDVSELVAQLSRRVDELEAAQRRLAAGTRRWRVAVGGLGLLTLAAVTAGGPVQGQNPPADRPTLQVLECKGLVIRDAKGKVRAQIVATDGATAVELFDPAGWRRLFLQAEDKAARLWVMTPENKSGLRLTSDANAAGVDLRTRGDKQTVALFGTDKFRAVRVSEPGGKAALFVQARASGPTLRLTDTDEKTLFVKPDPAP